MCHYRDLGARRRENRAAEAPDEEDDAGPAEKMDLPEVEAPEIEPPEIEEPEIADD